MERTGTGWVPLLRLVFAMRDLHLLPEEVCRVLNIVLLLRDNRLRERYHYFRM